jgi:hypothetical protein
MIAPGKVAGSVGEKAMAVLFQSSAAEDVQLKVYVPPPARSWKALPFGLAAYVHPAPPPVHDWLQPTV